MGTRSRGARGVDELSLAQGEHLSTHEAGDGHPGRGCEHDHRRDERGAVERDQHQGEEQARDGEHHVGRAHQQRVDPAAREAGRQADRGADDQRDQRGHRPDAQRDTRPVEQAAEHVAAEAVRPQEVQLPGVPAAGQIRGLESLPTRPAPVVQRAVCGRADLVGVAQLSIHEADRPDAGERREVAQDQAVGLGRGVAQTEPGSGNGGQADEEQEAARAGRAPADHRLVPLPPTRMRGSTAAIARSAARLPATTISAASNVAASTTETSCARIAS